MAELVYAFDLKSNGETRTGSSPVPATKQSASLPDAFFVVGGLGPSVQVPFRLPLFELKDAISAFFLARSINNSASQEENTNLAPFIFKQEI